MCVFKHVQEQRALVNGRKPLPWPHRKQWWPCGWQLLRLFKDESKYRFAAHYHALKHFSLYSGLQHFVQFLGNVTRFSFGLVPKQLLHGSSFWSHEKSVSSLKFELYVVITK